MIVARLDLARWMDFPGKKDSGRANGINGSLALVR